MVPGVTKLISFLLLFLGVFSQCLNEYGTQNLSDEQIAPTETISSTALGDEEEEPKVQQRIYPAQQFGYSAQNIRKPAELSTYSNTQQLSYHPPAFPPFIVLLYPSESCPGSLCQQKYYPSTTDEGGPYQRISYPSTFSPYNYRELLSQPQTQRKQPCRSQSCKNNCYSCQHKNLPDVTNSVPSMHAIDYSDSYQLYQSSSSNPFTNVKVEMIDDGSTKRIIDSDQDQDENDHVATTESSAFYAEEEIETVPSVTSWWSDSESVPSTHAINYKPTSNESIELSYFQNPSANGSIEIKNENASIPIDLWSAPIRQDVNDLQNSSDEPTVTTEVTTAAAEAAKKKKREKKKKKKTNKKKNNLPLSDIVSN